MSTKLTQPRSRHAAAYAMVAGSRVAPLTGKRLDGGAEDDSGKASHTGNPPPGILLVLDLARMQINSGTNQCRDISVR